MRPLALLPFRKNSRRLVSGSKPTSLILFIFLFAVTIFPKLAAGQGTFWTGAGNDDNWSTASNWSTGQPPTGSNTLEVFLNDSSLRTNLVQDLGNPFLMNRIVISGSNGADYSFSGQAMEFAGTNSNFSVVNQGTSTADNDWQLSAAQVGASAGAGSQLIHNGDISGTGVVRSSGGGEITFNGNYTSSGAMNVTNGITTFNGSMSGGDAVQVGGILAGSGIFGSGTDPNGRRDVELVGFGNSNELTIEATGTMTINGDFNVLAQSNFNNNPGVLGDNLVVNGTTRVGNGSLNIASTTFGGDGTIEVSGPGRLGIASGTTVLSGQTINVGTDNSLQPFLSGEGTIQGETNIGFGAFSGGAAVGSLTFDGAVNLARGQFGTEQTSGNNALTRSNLTANGNVRFTTDQASVGGDITGSGTFLIDAGTEVAFSGANLDSPLSLEIEGRANMNGGIVGSTQINANTKLLGGQLFASQTTFTGALDVFDGSEIGSNPNNEFNGVIRIVDGVSTFNGTFDTGVDTGGNDLGSVIIEDGADLITTNAQLNLKKINRGQLTDGTHSKEVCLEGGNLAGSMSLTDGLVVRTVFSSAINSGATVSVANTTEIQSGELRIESGAVLQGAGLVQVEASGTLDIQGNVFKDVNVLEDGMLEGIGLIDGNLVIDGMLGPGNSAGILEIDGEIDLTETSTVCIEIGGTDVGEFDVVDGRGVSTLNLDGGSLDISLLDGFRPTSLDRFDFFINFDSLSGAFGTSAGGSGGAGLLSFSNGQRINFAEGSFAIDYQANSIGLTDFQAVPEPTVPALLVGLCIATWARRKRFSI